MDDLTIIITSSMCVLCLVFLFIGLRARHDLEVYRANKRRYWARGAVAAVCTVVFMVVFELLFCR